MKKLIALLSVVLLTTSCSLFESKEDELKETWTWEIHMDVENEATEDEAKEETKDEGTATIDIKKSTIWDTSNKTEEEVVKEFEAELDSLFDLLEWDVQ